MRLFCWCLQFAPSCDAAVDDESEIICVDGGEREGLAGVFPSAHQRQHTPPLPPPCQPSLIAVQYLNKIHSKVGKLLETIKQTKHASFPVRIHIYLRYPPYHHLLSLIGCVTSL